MELKDALNQRKSVRSYTGEVPTKEQLDAVLEAADEAPVGMGRFDSLHITVVTNKDLLGAIDDAGAKIYGKPGAHPLYGAPVLILVSSKDEGNVASANVGDVLENMALAAVDQGLGSCFIYGGLVGLKGNSELVDRLGLPEGFKPVGSLIVGKTDEAPAPRELPASHHIARNVIE